MQNVLIERNYFVHRKIYTHLLNFFSKSLVLLWKLCTSHPYLQNNLTVSAKPKLLAWNTYSSPSKIPIRLRHFSFSERPFGEEITYTYLSFFFLLLKRMSLIIIDYLLQVKKHDDSATYFTCF